jgi:membrane protein DedA with SNARE-associated domain
VFAAAGASEYHLGKYVAVVALSRGFRYTAVAVLADLYGRAFIRVFRHPTQHLNWLLPFAAVAVVVIGVGILINRRLQKPRMV